MIKNASVVDSQTSNAYKNHIIVNILTEDKIKRLVVIFVQIFPYKGDTWLLNFYTSFYPMVKKSYQLIISFTRTLAISFLFLKSTLINKNLI